MPVSIGIVEGDLANRISDLMILKYADGLFGADEYIAGRLGFTESVSGGSHRLVLGRNIEPKQVLFVGVGTLTSFRYGEIRSFGRRALEIAQVYAPEARRITSPIHGPGYGLDERESLLALVAGFFDAIQAREIPNALATIEIVERDSRRAARLRGYLAEIYDTDEGPSKKRESSQSRSTSTIAENLVSYGKMSETKTKLFVAMPFKEDYVDEYDIAIREACDKAEIICERIDKQAYVGDILISIKNRISSYDGVIALLNESNPNVFLEIGYAWAKEKATALLIKQGHDLPFDIKGQKCIVYKSISGLRTTLELELKQLKNDGVFQTRASRSRGG